MKPINELLKPGRQKGIVSERKGKACTTVPISPEMAALLLETADVRKRVMFGLFLQNGLRVGEIISIKWGTLLSAMDGKMAKIKIPKQSRNGKVKFRDVVLRDELVADIKKFHLGQKADEYVFTAVRSNCRTLEKKHLSSAGFNKLLKQEMKAKGISSEGNISSHALRKTFCTELIRSLVGEGYTELEALFMAKDVMGHRSVETTRIYAGFQRKTNIEAIKLVNFYATRQTP